MPLDYKMKRTLRRHLTQKLGMNDLNLVIADMGLTVDDLAGNTKTALITSLLDHVDKREHTFPDLLQVIHDIRPDIDLQEFGGAAADFGGTAGQTPARPPARETAPALPPPSKAADQDPYENFDIVVEHMQGDQYLVRASYSYPKQAAQKEIQTFDAGSSQIEELFSFLEHLAAEKDDAKAFGKLLYDFLFPRSIHGLFASFRDRLRDEGRGVRVRLQINPPALTSLPWEYCFDEQKNLFLAKDRQTPVVRYIDQDFMPADLATAGRLRLLHLVASPSDKRPIDTAAEARLLQESLAAVSEQVEIRMLENPGPMLMLDTLNEFKPHVVHYTGHGEFRGGRGALLLVNQDDGEKKSQPLEAEQLADVLRSTSVKIVVLNACESAMVKEEAPAFMSVAQGLVLAGIPAVIAMQFKLPEYLSKRCTKALYTSLAAGAPLDKAVTEMRIAASLGARAQDQVLWGIPVLFMLSPDGRVWKENFTAAGGGSAVGGRPPQANSGSVSLSGVSAGGAITFGGDVTGRDKITTEVVPTPPSLHPAETGATQTQVAALVKQIGDLEQIMGSFLSSLGNSDRQDVIQNLADARGSLEEVEPNGLRAGRKLENIIEILSDANVGEMIIPLIKQLVAQVREV